MTGDRREALLAGVPFLAPLRPDELERAARRFRIVDLSPGEKRTLAVETPECIVVLSGRVDVEASPIDGFPPSRERLDRGDHVGVHALLAGRAFAGRFEAVTAARVALLDAQSYGELEGEFPVIAIPACTELANELAWRDDLLREVAAIRTHEHDQDERQAALAARRRRVARRVRQRGRRVAARLTLVGDILRVWAREPAFWMLLGFVGAFGGARAVVSWIFSHHAEKKLFALRYVAGFENPIHIHHFNYGLVLVTITSLLAFFPAFRQYLKGLGFFFGIGAGLIFDEFGLIWNLDPNYYQGLSWVAVLAGALVLAQLAFYRGAWTRRLRGLARRRAP